MKVLPQVRQAFDKTFMELLSLVRLEVLEAQAPEAAKTSPVLTMFFQETQKRVLQDLASLTAAWNKSEIDETTLKRALDTLIELGLTSAHKRLAQLSTIDEHSDKQDPKDEPSS